MINNEINGYTGIKFIVLTTMNKRGTIVLREESKYDSYGRNAHSQRGCTYPQVHTVLHQRPLQKRRAESRTDRWALEDQTRRFTKLCRKTSTRPEINKASNGWQRTIKDLVAFRLSARLWKVQANNPTIKLPIFSIHISLKFFKILCTNPWVCSRKEVYS